MKGRGASAEGAGRRLDQWLWFARLVKSRSLAARLCAEATDGQILIGQRVAVAVEQTTTLEEIGSLTLKGLTQPVIAFNVPVSAIQPALRVIEGGGPETV